MKPVEKTRFWFEGFVLDLKRGCVWGERGEIDLRPKSFEVLRYLVENAGRLVTKDELIKTVWRNVVVTDESLMQCVSEVRHAIADDGQTIIKTVPRRGYRFMAPVWRAAAAPRPALLPAESPLAGSDSGPRSQSSVDRPSVAVLPFANLSGDPQQDYFSDGITEDITTELSRFSELMVIARNSAFQYKGKAVDIRQIGRELGARYLLEGSVRRSGGRIRIAAQLIDALTGTHPWAERYGPELHDAFAGREQGVRAIVAILAACVKRCRA